MYLDSTRGLVERCARCGREAEVDDAADARAWGVNHEYAYHTRHDEECPRCGLPLVAHPAECPWNLPR